MVRMAQKKQVVITDDIDGSADAKPYTFAFNGTTYEIDLAPANRDSLIRALQPFIDNGRRVPRGKSPSGSRPSTP